MDTQQPADIAGSVSFRELRDRVSFTARVVVKSLNDNATDELDRDLVRAGGHAIWTLGMVGVGIYQELNEIKHELREANRLARER